MNRLSKTNASNAPRGTKVVISDKPDAQEIDNALQQLKQGKKLYSRLNSRGESILTTKAPRWYTFKASKEQHTAASMLKNVLARTTPIASINNNASTAAASLAGGARNTDAIRKAVAELAGYATAMGIGRTGQQGSAAQPGYGTRQG